MITPDDNEYGSDVDGDGQEHALMIDSFHTGFDCTILESIVNTHTKTAPLLLPSDGVKTMTIHTSTATAPAAPPPLTASPLSNHPQLSVSTSESKYVI